MLIHEMHYDFKIKVNGVDSNKFSNFNTPEIDWLLNEAQRIWVKSIAFPRYKSPVSVEVNHRSRADLYRVIHNDSVFKTTNLSKFEDKSYLYAVKDIEPSYWYFLSGYAQTSKGVCTRSIRLYETQHDDLNEESPFSVSSFEYEEVNFHFFDKGIRIFTDGTFEITGVKLNYIRDLVYMHNAQDFKEGKYISLNSGEELTGRVHSEFSDSREICSEIVDIAVLLVTTSVYPDPNAVRAKLALTDKRV